MTLISGLRKGSAILLMLALVASISFSQKTKFYINADFANFRYDNNSAYLEFYYSFNQAQFKLINSGSDFNGAAIISLVIKQKSNDSVISVNRWKNPIKITDTSSAVINHQMTGVQGFQLPFGEYKATVICYDENNPSSRDSQVVNLKAILPNDKLFLSDIQLSSQVKQAPKDEKNIFYKNTLEVIPHPTAVFGLGLPIMYLYVEAYNLNKIKSPSYSYSAQVIDRSGNLIKEMKKSRKKINESSVEISTVNCSDLPSGTYVIKCILSDSADSTISATTARKFFIYNPQVVPPKTNTAITSMMTSEYGTMKEDEIDREFETVKYVAIAKEKDEYAGLTTLEGKKIFMVNFWNNRDLDDDPAVNLYKEKYKKNLRYVNQNYRTGQREGWKTDRGRVYLMYGQPDEVERHPNEVDAKPYEIWYYHNLTGGVEFVFVDRSSMGDYILVHSTYRNELSDTTWERLLK